MADRIRKDGYKESARRGNVLPRVSPGSALLALVMVVTAALVVGGGMNGGGGPAPAAAAASSGRTAICTFTNPAYAGECVETTAIPEGSTPMKACLAILDCLNNPQCAKTYCNASTIRVGWRLKAADEE